MLQRLPGFVPNDLRQLLSFVPTRGYDAIEWRPLLRRLRQISWQLTRGKGVRALAASTGELTDVLSLERRPRGTVPLDSLTERDKKACGDAILRFYFAQWRNPDGLFLDLRPARFSHSEEHLYFRPSGLWCQLEDAFRLGMIDLYRGFYQPDPALLDDALHRMGFLRDDLTEEEANALRQLLQTHFGADQRAQAFEIDNFRQSFDALFDFFIDHRYRLPSDFVVVGFYLITLYLVLESLGQRHNVRKICRDELLSG